MQGADADADEDAATEEKGVKEPTAARMARFAQAHREEIAMYKAAGIGIKEVSILGAGKTDPGFEACLACIALNGTVWPIDRCPPLPYSGCTNRQLGCRCVTLAVIPP